MNVENPPVQPGPPAAEPSASLSPHNVVLVCPETKQKVRLCALDEADRAARAALTPRVASGPEAFGRTATVMLREDNRCAYPVIDDIPIFLGPEMLVAGSARQVNLEDPRYAEAYEEMTFYNKVATEEAQNVAKTGKVDPLLERVRHATAQQLETFPEPHPFWLDATYDCAAQYDAYRNLGPMPGKRIVQLGGKGLAAMLFLAAGAAETWLVTPMLGELRYARAVAQAMGFADRFHGVAAIAEELPFANDSFDGVYAGGCVHHMVTTLALPEIKRILKPGGRFSAIEPWRAPLYRIGTAIFGKREVDVHCKPLTKLRVQPMFEAFPEGQLVHHGTVTRYPLLALMKLGVDSKLATVWRWNKLDDTVCSCIPGLRAMGSSVALLARK
jgi:SAM-dependent methyltransferase/uncharacterized protein YbaR (Trm112 family)